MTAQRQLTVTEQRNATLGEIKTQFERQTDQLAALLPSHVKPDQFIRVALIAIQRENTLLEADRRSLFTACQKCASDGLLPDGREAALVVFKGTVQYMPMVYGLIKKVRQSGEVSELRSRVVYANDRFRYVLGDAEIIEHEPTLAPDPGKPIAVYAIATLKDGGVEREVMTISQVEKIRAVSRTSRADSPWNNWWDEMARKTVTRRLCKRLPFSAEIMRALDRDDEIEREVAAIEPPARPVRQIAADEPEATPEQIAAAEEASRALDREADAIATGRIDTDEPHDPTTGEVTEPTKPKDTVTNWDQFLSTHRAAIKAATDLTALMLVAQAIREHQPPVQALVAKSLAGAISARRKELDMTAMSGGD